MTSQATSARGVLHGILLSKARMEALTDGIFAIGMTLLVLELKVPDLPKTASSSEIFSRLGAEMPVFFSFLISFLYCGLLWLMHHLAMHFIRHLQVALVWLNLIFLMSISVMPFSCALLGHFFRTRAVQELYFGNMFVAAVLLALQWLVAEKKKLINEDDLRASQLMGQRVKVFPLALLAAMAATLIKPIAGFYAMAFVLIVQRVWQKRWHRLQTKNPATLSS